MSRKQLLDLMRGPAPDAAELYGGRQNPCFLPTRNRRAVAVEQGGKPRWSNERELTDFVRRLAGASFQWNAFAGHMTSGSCTGGLK